MTKQGRRKLLKIGISSCVLLILGILLSGPLGILFTLFTKPQPSWVDAQTFAASFNFLQTVPYFFGFLLIIGSVLLVTSTYKLVSEDDKSIMLPSIIFISIYASLISLNYIIQTTFVPALATAYSSEYGVLISVLSMSNPSSLAWAIEMYGYAFLGIATLFLMPFFKGGKLEMAIRSLLIINALISVIGAIVTSFNLSWVLTTAGFISFFAWNILYFSIVVLILISFRRSLKLYE